MSHISPEHSCIVMFVYCCHECLCFGSCFVSSLVLSLIVSLMCRDHFHLCSVFSCLTFVSCHYSASYWPSSVFLFVCFEYPLDIVVHWSPNLCLFPIPEFDSLFGSAAFQIKRLLLHLRLSQPNITWQYIGVSTKIIHSNT